MLFPKAKPEPAYPALPPSLKHESFELVDATRGQDPQARSSTAPHVTPYLGLRARLSQIWINRWTVLLLLVLARTLLTIDDLDDNLAEAKIKALSACTKVEDIGSAVASMPHYLSVGVNSLAASGITDAVSALVSILGLIITGVEELIKFIIKLYAGTYACLLLALVHGGLDLAVGAVDGAVNVFNDNIGNIVGEIDEAVRAVQDTINKAFAGLSDVSGFFGQDFTVPVIDITGHLDDLKNIQIDDHAFVQGLVRVNETIPDFKEAEKLTSDAIAIPFDLLKTQINKTYGAYQFDHTIFPVAAKESLTFCSSNSALNDFFVGLFELLAKAKIIAIVVLALLAVLIAVPMAYLEILRWRRQQRRARILTKYGFDGMDIVYIASRPFTANFGIKLSDRFKSDRRKVLVRWAVAYATSLPAIFVLSLAIAGFFGCFTSWILMRAVQKEAPALAAQVGDFTGDVVNALKNVSTRWADDANGVILTTQSDINEEMFGWVRDATAAINGTITKFDDEFNRGLDLVFQNTPLYNIVKNTVYCLIGSKLDMAEAGLTWVHDHAMVTLPMFPADVFSLGANDSINGDTGLTSFLASPSTVTTDEVTDAVDHVVRKLHNSIIRDALISLVLLLIYIAVVLIGIIRSLVGMSLPDHGGREGHTPYVTPEAIAGGNGAALTGDGRGPPSPRSPRRAKSEANIRAFDDPTPSPQPPQEYSEKPRIGSNRLHAGSFR